MYASRLLLLGLWGLLLCGPGAGSAIAEGTNTNHFCTIINSSHVEVYGLNVYADPEVPGVYNDYHFWTTEYISPGESVTILSDSGAYNYAGGSSTASGKLILESGAWKDNTTVTVTDLPKTVITAGQDETVSLEYDQQGGLRWSNWAQPGGGEQAGGLTNWQQFENPTNMAPGFSEMLGGYRDSGTNILHQAETQGTNWVLGLGMGMVRQGAALLDRGTAEGSGAHSFTNGMGEWGEFSPEAPDPEDHWFQANLPGWQVGGQSVYRSWEFVCDPTTTVSGGEGEIDTLLGFIKMVWEIFISFSLWYMIKTDVEEKLKELWYIPQPNAQGFEGFGFSAGIAFQLVAAAAITAVIFVAAQQLTARLLGVAVGASSWSDLKLALETGVINGVGVSIWLGKIVWWVAKAFPFGAAVTAILAWVSYVIFRGPVVRLASLAVKYCGIACIAGACFLQPATGEASVRVTGMFTAYTDGMTWWSDGQVAQLSLPSGVYVLSCPSFGSYDITLPVITELNWSNPGQVTWSTAVPTFPLSSGTLAIWFDGANGVTVCAYTPDEAGTERATDLVRCLEWGSVGACLGISLAIVSLAGFAWKKGLSPGRWGGDA